MGGGGGGGGEKRGGKGGEMERGMGRGRGGTCIYM